MSRRKPILVLAACLLAAAAAADDFEPVADDLLGVWLTADEGDSRSRIEIYLEDERYHGRIVHLDSPVYPPDSDQGTPGEPRTDLNNPDEALHDRPILGLRLMRDFRFHKGKWRDGRIYDPNNGKEYRCKLTLKGRDNLEVFGYIKVGFVKLGRNTAWTRWTGESSLEPED